MDRRYRLALMGVIGAVLAVALGPGAGWAGASPSLRAIDSPYVIGSVSVTTIWVDPRSGSDDRTGATRQDALRTLAAAWRRVPMGGTLARGYRMMITSGRLGASSVPGYFESRHGTPTHPIIIEAADGPGTVRLPAFHVFDTHYLYLVNLRIDSRSGEGFHCERCDHVLLRGLTVRGMPRENYAVGDLVKFNQSTNIFIEDSDISGASDNAIDFVAVQYAAIRRTAIHDAGDWCAYAKGGSAYIRVNANEIYDCGVGGFTAGQGTGFQFMTSPWIHYEAYDVKVVNNVVHDVWGAGLGVNGGYNILFAFNTLYAVGSRSHLLEFVAGGRSCDGAPGDAGRDRCDDYLSVGGWGTTRVGDGENYVRIPNRHVYVYDNVIVNPAGEPVGDQQFTVAGAYAGPGQTGSHVPVPTAFDDDLRILGNVIWNGPSGMPLGLGATTGCRSTNPTCSAAIILAGNSINVREPLLRAPHAGDYRLARPGSWRAMPIPAFSWGDLPAVIPPGSLDNAVPRDRVGRPRGVGAPPGAFVS